MTENRQSAGVDEFLACFAKLKDECDDDPDIVEETASNDPNFRKLCRQIFDLRLQLGGEQLEHPEQFIAPVKTDFIKAWRDYDERYSSAVLWAALFSGLDPDLRSGWRSSAKRRPQQPEDDEWAESCAESIEWAFRYLRVLSSEGEYDDEEAKSCMDEAVTWWEFLKSGTGLDLQGIFRRKMLVPFVLVPHHLSVRYGNSAQPSLFDLLREAQRAFIFGSLLSSVSLMRATLEQLLVAHYNASGVDLKCKIDNVLGLSSWSKQKLHAIRRLANDVLHTGDSEGSVSHGMPSEREVALHLDTLRNLIERAPALRPGTQRL